MYSFLMVRFGPKVPSVFDIHLFKERDRAATKKRNHAAYNAHQQGQERLMMKSHISYRLHRPYTGEAKKGGLCPFE